MMSFKYPDSNSSAFPKKHFLPKNHPAPHLSTFDEYNDDGQYWLEYFAEHGGFNPDHFEITVGNPIQDPVLVVRGGKHKLMFPETHKLRAYYENQRVWESSSSFGNPHLETYSS
jgi:hypothetical protein